MSEREPCNREWDVESTGAQLACDLPSDHIGSHQAHWNGCVWSAPDLDDLEDRP